MPKDICRQEEQSRAQQPTRGRYGHQGNDKWSNKLSSAFSHKPMVVTDIRGIAVTAADENHTIRRKPSRFKKILAPLPCFKEMSGGEIDVPTTVIVSSASYSSSPQRRAYR